MSNPDDVSRITWFADNEANWDDRADLHMGGGYSGIDELVADRTAISRELARDIERFGDLAGKDVIHLQCHLGTDTIGFARRGAHRVVGIDLSGNSLDYARRIAEAAGVDVEYLHSNVYDARTAVESDFDLVYTSLGVLCWLPDIDAWARTVAALLKRDGMFFIRDDHPMSMTIDDLTPDDPASLRVVLPYFQREQPSTWEEEGSYADAPEAPRVKNTRNHQWNHSLGEIITALLRAGLVIDLVEETPYSAWCRWPDLMVKDPNGWRLREAPERMPLQFAIEAHKQ